MSINVDLDTKQSASTIVDANSDLVAANTFPASDIIPANVLASTFVWTLIPIFLVEY